MDGPHWRDPTGHGTREANAHRLRTAAVHIRRVPAILRLPMPPPAPNPRSPRTTLRLVLGLWAAAIYAVYWFGYLRGGT
jgi:hypothetical protein